MAYVGEIISDAQGRPQIVEEVKPGMTVTRPARPEELQNRSLPASISPEYNPNLPQNLPAAPAQSVEILGGLPTGQDKASMYAEGYVYEGQKGNVQVWIRQQGPPLASGTYGAEGGGTWTVENQPVQKLIKDGQAVATFQGGITISAEGTEAPTNEGYLGVTESGAKVWVPAKAIRDQEQAAFIKNQDSQKVGDITFQFHEVENKQHTGMTTSTYELGPAPEKPEDNAFEQFAYGVIKWSPLMLVPAIAHYGFTEQGKGEFMEGIDTFFSKPGGPAIVASSIILPMAEDAKSALYRAGSASPMDAVLGKKVDFEAWGEVAGMFGPFILERIMQGKVVKSPEAKTRTITVEGKKYVYDAEVLDFEYTKTKAGISLIPEAKVKYHLGPVKAVTHREIIISEKPLTTQAFDMDVIKVTDIYVRGEPGAPPVRVIGNFEVSPGGIKNVQTGEVFRDIKMEIMPEPKIIAEYGHAREVNKPTLKVREASLTTITETVDPEYLKRLRYKEAYYTESAKSFGYRVGDPMLMTKVWKAEEFNFYFPKEPAGTAPSQFVFRDAISTDKSVDFSFLKTDEKPIAPSKAPAEPGSGAGIILEQLRERKVKSSQPIIKADLMEVIPAQKVKVKYYDGSVYQTGDVLDFGAMTRTDFGALLFQQRSTNIKQGMAMRQEFTFDIPQQNALKREKIMQELELIKFNDELTKIEAPKKAIMRMNVQDLDMGLGQEQAQRQERIAPQMPFMRGGMARGRGFDVKIKPDEITDMKPPGKADFLPDIMRGGPGPGMSTLRYSEKIWPIMSGKKLLKRLF